MILNSHSRPASAEERLLADLTTLPFGAQADCWLPSISEKLYHSARAASAHGMTLIHQRNLHAFLHGESSDSPAKQDGRICHAAVLQPEQFAQQYVPLPHAIAAMNKNSNAYKDALSEFRAAHRGQDVISLDQFELATRIAELVHGDRDIAPLFCGGQSELTGVFRDQATGIVCKLRADYITDHLITDLKIVDDASDESIARAIHNFRYHANQSWYQDGALEIDGKRRDFLFVFVEKHAPYFARIVEIPERAILRGRAENRNALDALALAAFARDFPGYTKRAVIDLPAWAYKTEVSAPAHLAVIENHVALPIRPQSGPVPGVSAQVAAQGQLANVTQEPSATTNGAENSDDIYQSLTL